MKNRLNGALLGSIFIALGICCAGNEFNLWDFRLLFKGWWTLLIIIPCLFSIIGDKFKMGNIIGLFIGITLLLSEQEIISGVIIGKLIVPSVLVLIGVNILLKNRKREIINIYDIDRSNRLEYIAIFSGLEETFINEEFNGSSMLALFGGIDLNLKEAYINRNVVINATCILGGIDIIAPKNVNIKIHSIPVLGETSNLTKPILDKESFTIYINATCVLGGIDVK